VTVQTYIKGTSSVQISRSIEAGVREGRLGPGDKLPPVRALATHLGVSPATVAAAYKALQSRGVLLGGGRRGTTVTRTPPVRTRPHAPVPPGVRNLAHGSPDPKLLPPLAPALRSIDATHTMYGCALMVPELARAARRDLERDGVAVDALAVVSGGMDGIERVLAVDLKAGDRVVIEDPGFTSVIDLLTALGLKIVPCVVDDRGLVPAALEHALATPARAVVITPRAQNPSGAAMDEARARELKRIVRAHADLLVIEDDHGAGVAGAPLHTLCDGSLERWAFVRSVSKSLGPDLRLALLSGDAETVARVEGRQMMGARWVSHLLQRTAAALWSEPGTATLLRKAEKTYTARRRAMLDALARHGIEAHGCSGMNVWIPVPEETAIAQALLDRGWAVIAGERFRIESTPGIRVTISTLEPAEAQKLAADIAELLDARGVSTHA
jgi:DNA-binding transcriptional MocR family regulator